MLQPIINFLEKYTDIITDEDKEIIFAHNSIKSAKKKEILKSFSDEENLSFFVLTGCVYCSSLIEEKESISGFYFEGEPIIPPISAQENSFPYQLICLEDSTIAVSSEEQTEKLILQSPKFERVCRLFAEKHLNEKFQFYESLKAMSSKEKYQFIKKAYPHLIDRVPDFLLANYLGISPETLSRIKK